jgi:hypothetical protein
LPLHLSRLGVKRRFRARCDPPPPIRAARSHDVCTCIASGCWAVTASALLRSGAARTWMNEMGMHCGSNISSFTIIAWCAHGGRRSVGTPVGSHHAFFDPCSFAMASNSYLQSVYPMPIPTPAPRPAAAVRADGVPARAQRIDARNAVKRESTHACKAALCHGISHTPEQEFCEAVGQRAYGTESSRPAPPQARRTPACARCSLCTGPMSPRPAKRGGAIKKRGAEEK